MKWVVNYGLSRYNDDDSGTHEIGEHNNVDFVRGEVEGARVLVADLICHRGETLTYVEKQLGYVCEEFVVACLFASTQNRFRGKLMSVQTMQPESWIEFPWEKDGYKCAASSG